MSNKQQTAACVGEPVININTANSNCASCQVESGMRHKPDCEGGQHKLLSGSALRVYEAKEMLRKFLKPGDTVHCVLRSVSKSGMSRRIDFYVIVNGEESTRGCHYLQYLSGWMGTLGIGSWNPDKQGLRVNGCGMDMGFHCVYTLAGMLFKDNPKRTDGDAGYMLRSEWI